MIKLFLTALALYLAFLGGRAIAGPAGDSDNSAGSDTFIYPAAQIVVDLRTQKLFLFKNGRVCLATGISTGRPGHRTPRGYYWITEKAVHHISSIYKVNMPYFMRLDGELFGIHYGYNPGRPASHGCIRVESMANAQALFNQTPSGTRVTVE